MRWMKTGILTLVFAVVFGFAVFLQDGLIEKMSERREDAEFILPSTSTIQYVSSGYRHFIADLLWLRAIQIFGAAQTRTDVNVESLWSYFQTITDLDPHFVSAYIFGNLVFGEEIGEWRKGLAILDKGIENNPEKYRPAFEAAYYSFWQLEQPELAKEYVEVALQAEDAPDWLERWPTFLDQKMGRYKAAFGQYLEDWVRYYNAGDDTLREMAEKKLRDSMEEWICEETRSKAIAWEEEHGEYPSVEQLERTGAFLDTELPDWVPLFAQIQQMMEAGQEIDDDPEYLREIAETYTRTGWQQLPPAPANFNRYFYRFMIWPGTKPMAGDNPNPWFCSAELRIAERAQKLLEAASNRLKNYQKEHDGECPPDLITGAPGLLSFEEPWGGEWTFDPDRCVVYSSTHPRLYQKVY